jgi:phosphoribosylaminoimidazole carboxylase PurK protein
MFTIGILGDGQLALMLVDAARPLGYRVIVLGPDPRGPGAQVADQHIPRSFNDPEAIRYLAQRCDFLTIEIESVDAQALRDMNVGRGWAEVNPTGSTISSIQDKLLQKSLLLERGIPTPRFASIDSLEDMYRIGEQFGYPFMVKARFGGYDGRGNAVVASRDNCQEVWTRFAGTPIYAEQYVDLAAELATIVVRPADGSLITYPIVETIQQNNICHEVIAPANFEPQICNAARRLAINTVRIFSGRGAFGVEMFLDKKGNVSLNELAPRVHNSGHYTIQACRTSQFEQHIRAVGGTPAGSSEMLVRSAVMINILGDRDGAALPQGIAEAESIPGVSVHFYGKPETRVARKMGHLTAVGEDPATVLERARQARALLSV